MKKSIIYPTVTHATGDSGADITISTMVVDRDGDRVIPEGVQLDAYRRNPVVLWAHDYQSLPIATTTSIRVDPGVGIRAQFKWLEGDAFAQRVRNAWDQGILRAASIGFIALESRPNAAGRGYDFTRSDLAEWSIVPVPANPEAVRTLKSLGLDPFGDALRQALAELRQSPRVSDPEPFVPGATRLLPIGGGRFVKVHSISQAFPILKGGRWS